MSNEKSGANGAVELSAPDKPSGAVVELDIHNLTPDEIKREKRRIWKNIILISLAFLFNFNAFQGLSRLQSSLHIDDGMGTISLSVLYGALVLSCMFLPHIIIAMIGHKYTIVVSFSGYILWMVANGYAVWGTMIPASIYLGLCAAPLWTAQCSYFSKMAARYATITGQEEGAVVSTMFGIFFMFFQFSSITGSIIMATILKPQPENGTEISYPDNASLAYCGAKDCPDNGADNPNLQNPSKAIVWRMLGIYIGIALCAVVLVIVFVDKLPKELQEKKKMRQVKVEIKELLISTFKHLKNKSQLMLLVITMYSGFEQAFYNAEWSKSYITCSSGIWKIGLITLPFGVVNCVVSLSGGVLVKYTGRIPVFITGIVVDLCIQFTLMFWMPDPDESYVFYIISGMWGITDAIWQTQLNALYGSIFISNSEAAFSNYRMWESFGFIIAFAYSSYLCTSVKLYVLTSVLVVGMVGYFATEVHNRRQGSGDMSATQNMPDDSKITDMKEKYAYTNEAWTSDLNNS